jgi:hypothetical protein
MSRARIAIAAAAAGLLLLIAPMPVAGAKKLRLPKCNAPAHTLTVSTARIRVFRLRYKLYSCWRPTHRVTLLFPVTAAEGGMVDETPAPVIVGHYVGFATSYFSDPSGQYDQVFSVNARYGHSVHRVKPRLDSFADSIVASFVMDARGSIAFIQELGPGGGGGPCPRGDKIDAAVVAVDRVGTRTLDCETGDEVAGQGIANLTLAGHVITWRHHGAAHIAALR